MSIVSLDDTQAINLRKEACIAAAIKKAEDEVSEYAKKTVMEYLRRSDNEKRLIDVGHAAAKAVIDEIDAFHFIDLIPGAGHARKLSEINEKLQKSVDEAVRGETELIIEEYVDSTSDD